MLQKQERSLALSRVSINGRNESLNRAGGRVRGEGVAPRPCLPEEHGSLVSFSCLLCNCRRCYTSGFLTHVTFHYLAP